MRYFCAFVLLMVFISAQAQYPSGGGARGANNAVGSFYGKIIDASTNKSIAGVSIQLIQSKFDTATKKKKEVVVATQITQSNGNFVIENLSIKAQYTLKISGVGYIAFDQALSFENKPTVNGVTAINSFDKDLGNIKLKIDSKQLEEITITATKPFMQMGVDRKIFNVEKNIMSTGQTATELMKNIPGLNVDIDGNVSLRNAAPTIFVDGRPTTLSLDQIPSDVIASVEIITNPSAKYDASGGMAGILNIVLKKNKKTGYNGNLRTGIDSRARINAGGDLNVRQGKFNFSISSMLNQRKSKGIGQSIREENYYTPNITFRQNNAPIRDGYYMYLRGGVDYFMDIRNTFSLTASTSQGSFNNTDNIDIQTDTLKSIVSSSFSKRSTVSESDFNSGNFTLGYKRLFKKPGMDLTSDLNLSSFTSKNSGQFNTQILDSYKLPKGNPFVQTQNGNSKSRNLTFQTDFTNTYSEKSKLETGIRAAVRNVNSENLNYIINNGVSTPINSVNAKYKYVDKVYAAYFNYSNLIGKDFSYQAGFRVESSTYEGTLLTTNAPFKNSFPLSLFPSLFLTKKINNSEDLQLSYSRRVNRPNFFQLLPFIDYTDSLNISRGNPGLVPEFTHSLELSYQIGFPKGHNLLISSWLKLSDHLITRYQVKETSTVQGKDVIINTYINANNSRAYGVEITARDPLTKWLDVTSNVNFYNSYINNQNISTLSPQSPIWSIFAKMNMAIKLPNNYSVQLSGEYQSKTVMPQGGGYGGGGMGGGSSSGGRSGGGGGNWGGFVQTTAQGYVKPFYNIEAAVKKDFLKEKRGSISASINDIFRSRKNASFSQSDYFIQNVERRQDWRLVRLNFSYRFGKVDMSLFKRKNTKTGEGSEGMQMQ
jgi:outer membrane receptor protein involved in Fe transport